MKRLLLDTNIYGLIVKNTEGPQFEESIKKIGVIIYGCSVVRKELRDTPKNNRVLTENGIRSVRILLLNLYDTVTKNHEIIIDEKTQQLANKYLQQYTNFTGKTSLYHLKNDFLLIACASLNNLDIVVSEDHKTLLSNDAIQSYKQVNEKENIILPFIITYEELKKMFRRLFPL